MSCFRFRTQLKDGSAKQGKILHSLGALSICIESSVCIDIRSRAV